MPSDTRNRPLESPSYLITFCFVLPAGCLVILSQSNNLISLTGAVPLSHWRRIRPVTLIAGVCAPTAFPSLGIDAVNAQ